MYSVLTVIFHHELGHITISDLVLRKKSNKTHALVSQTDYSLLTKLWE